MQTRVRRWLPLALLGVGAVCALAWILMPPVRRGPSLTQLESVTPGMTHEQVVALIGYPPGDHRTDPQRFSVSHHSIKRSAQHRQEVWLTDDGILEVYYDVDDRVVLSDVRNTKDTRPPWFTQQIRRFMP